MRFLLITTVLILTMLFARTVNAERWQGLIASTIAYEIAKSEVKPVVKPKAKPEAKNRPIYNQRRFQLFRGRF